MSLASVVVTVVVGMSAVHGDARHLITVKDLPPPNATPSADNSPDVVAQPKGAWPAVPAGFRVERFFTKLTNPREIRTAPNGDLFVAESEPGRIHILRVGKDGKLAEESVYASGLEQPFGIAFYPPGSSPRFVYVAETGRVRRYPYVNGDLKARGAGEVVIPDIPSGGHLHGGGHWTRDLAFSNDGKTLFVSVGSHSNDMGHDAKAEQRRADILAFDPDGRHERIYASGIRNAVGIAVNPATGQLWCSVNERDELGDDLVPDYITHVEPGGFYGWPWFYLGAHEDPRHKGEHPELASKVIVPDVLVASHSASLEMVFDDSATFPHAWAHDAFAAEHGSWNRARRTGYEVIRVGLDEKGHATGEYDDFMTGFVTADGKVWGRPVGVAFGKDGALYVTDDGGDVVWRVSPVRR